MTVATARAAADLAHADIASFIQTRMHLRTVPCLPALWIYAAHPGSGLSQIAISDDPPYWAYLWAGGLALAHHFEAHPDAVRGRRVLDLGAGSGLVGIAAAKAGARAVIAAETDANGAAAIALNSVANGVHVDIVTRDLLDTQPPPVDVVAVGDLFYARDLAARVMAFLTRCRAAGLDILIGDPERTALPIRRLRTIATYDVTDFGLASKNERVRGKVFTLDDMT